MYIWAYIYIYIYVLFFLRDFCEYIYIYIYICPYKKGGDWGTVGFFRFKLQDFIG